MRPGARAGEMHGEPQEGLAPAHAGVPLHRRLLGRLPGGLQGRLLGSDGVAQSTGATPTVDNWIRVRVICTVGAALAAGGMIQVAVMPEAYRGLDITLYWWLLTGLTLLFIAGAIWGRRAPQSTLAVSLLLSMVAVAIDSVARNVGLATPSTGYILLMPIVAAVGCRFWVAVGIALASMATCTLVWLRVEPQQIAAAMLEQSTRSMQIIDVITLLACGIVTGLATAASMKQFERRLQARDARFQALLSTAADLYWEAGPEGGLSNASTLQPAGRGTEIEAGLLRGVALTAQPTLRWREPDAQRLTAALREGQPFRDLPVDCIAADGTVLHLTLTGHPRTDAEGRSAGHWGVVRDITESVAVRDTLEAAEDRYEDLFTYLPTPLVVSRRGRIVDANPAALAMLCGPDAQPGELIGAELAALHEAGDSRDRALERLHVAARLLPGEALPVEDFRLVGADAAPLLTRATSMQVMLREGPATLTILVDDTKRRAAEAAVRRSEMLLSQLVAATPDLVALRERDSGRFVLVNAQFEAVTGVPSALALGRTAVELGLCNAGRSPAAHEPLPLSDHDENSELTIRGRDGQSVMLRMSAAHFTADEREFTVTIARDVTEQERERRETEAILGAASVGVVLLRQRKIARANLWLATQLHAGSPESLIGRRAGLLFSQQADCDRFKAAQHQAELEGRWRSQSPVVQECAMLRDDGSTFIARISSSPVDDSLAPPEGPQVWIIEDITAQRESQQALHRARDAAESANRAKSAFLANTSHELRTPLHAMIGLARLAAGSEVGEPVRRQYLQQMVDSAQSLATLITDVLDLSKIEAGKLVVDLRAFDLGQLLRSIAAGYEVLARSKGLAMSLHIDPQVQGWVLGDDLRLRQILGNYLGNAVKFTAAGTVRLSAQRDGTDVRFVVQDTGPGIDEKSSPWLFEPFTQADASTTRRYGGTGLGLSICRELAKLMGGSVGVDSRLGSGSQFWVEIPLPQIDEPDSLTQAAGAAESGGPIDLPPPAPVPSPSPSPVPAGIDTQAPRTLAGLRVLMVEDNPVNMLIGVAMLQQWQAEVLQASDGLEALALLEQTRRGADPRDAGKPDGSSGSEEGTQRSDDAPPVDAIVMDLQMPRMGGFELTERLRRRWSGAQLPIIALTAAALTSEREQALASGMSEFLAKPIEPDALRDALLRCVQAREDARSA